MVTGQLIVPCNTSLAGRAWISSLYRVSIGALFIQAYRTVHRERFAEIKEDLASEGVRILVSSRDQEGIGCSPASDGDPSTATLHVTEGMSLSAWEREYDHFKFDRDHGYPGLKAFLIDASLREESEGPAYGVEIEMASEKGMMDLQRG